MPFNIKFHGSLGEVTGSCTFIKIISSGNLYAIDCGSSHKKNLNDEPAYPENLPKDCNISKIKGLFLTHAHMDHIGMLLHWVKYGFRGKIYCTAETARFAVHMLEDSVRVNEREKVETGVGEAEMSKVKSFLNSYTACIPGKEFELENLVNVNSFPSSHIIGCVGFQFSAKSLIGDDCRVYFTGDVGSVENEAETMSMMRTRLRPTKPSNYIITESTYGGKSRQKINRSGKQRVAKLSQVIERGFRHGVKSKVIFPCFSLQRAQDLLLDIFQVLCYNRASTGLADGVAPKIYLDSRLTSLLMHEYSEIYLNGVSEGSPWVNPNSLFINDYGLDEARAKDTIEKLFRFKNTGDCVRLYDAQQNPGTAVEVFCGPFRPNTRGPVIVICGSGMTISGAIQGYLRDYLEDETATFVLSGYVPPRSPGAILRELSELPESERSKVKFEIKEDKYRSLPKKNLFGSDIKAQCSLVSEFYSGHADGPSICRYILGGNSDSLSQPPKRVFLIHGEDDKRRELQNLFNEKIINAGIKNYNSLIQCPSQESPWFDCEKNKWLVTRPTKLSLSILIKSEKLLHAQILQIVKMSCMAKEIKNMGGSLMVSYFADFNASTINTTLKLTDISKNCFKLTVESDFSKVQNVTDIRKGAFRWREVLNALGVQKRDYFAGHSYCGTDSEYEEIEKIIRNLVASGKQRQIGFIVAGTSAFLPEEVSMFEALLTPHIHFYIVDELYLSRLNTILFPQDPNKITSSNAFYIPVSVSKSAVKISKPFNSDWLNSLLGIVDSDLGIINSRQPFAPPIAKSGTQDLVKNTELVDSKKGIPKSRAVIPEEAYKVLTKGQLVEVTVVKPLERRNKELVGYSLKVKSTGALGILRSINFIEGKFDYPIGTDLKAYVKDVCSLQREVEFVMLLPLYGANNIQHIQENISKLTYGDLAKLLQLEYTKFKGYYLDHFKHLGNEDLIKNQDTLILSGCEIQIYDVIRRQIEEDRERKMSIAPPPKEFTFCQMADLMGDYNWKSLDIYNVLKYFEKAEQPDVSGMAKSILKNLATGLDSDLFPIEHKNLFVAACVEASAGKWPRNVPRVTILPARVLPSPSFYSLNELASKWGVSPAQLLIEAESLGIKILPQVALTSDDAVRLRALALGNNKRV